jgi:N-acetylglucosaminyl-diphospho-decaprenol L-rhamnosyltransferase
MSAFDVEISIVNHENRELVGRCLASLPAACEGLAWHVTVVDNVSGDGSIEMLANEFPEVAVIANRVRRGFGANHNQVLRRVLADGTARFVLVLNDDTELEPDAVTRLVRTMERDAALGAVAPRIVDPNGEVSDSRFVYPTMATVLEFDRTGRTEAPSTDSGWLQGCCLLVRVAAIERVGAFDERFFLFWEDVDLSRRLEADGWSLAVCDEAVVIHVGHASVFKADVVGRTYRQGLRSRYLYFAKYRGESRSRLISWAGRSVYLLRAAQAAAGAIVRRDRSRRTHARHLWRLASYDPRRPVFAEPGVAFGAGENHRP